MTVPRGCGSPDQRLWAFWQAGVKPRGRSRIECETLALDRPGDRIRDGDGRTGLPEKLSPPIRAGPWQGAAASKIDAWESDAPAFASSGLAGFVYF